VIITVRRSGGLAGNVEHLGAVDTLHVGSEEAAKVAGLLPALARAAHVAQEEIVGTDLMQYEIDVEDDDGRKRSMVVPYESDATSLPPPLTELLRLVR
jgi:hypothetical protein